MGIEGEPRNRYESILSLENDLETRNKYEKLVETSALLEVFGELGRQKDVRPNLARGETNISIPAYFSLDGVAHNPLNEAVLDLIPGFSYKAGYGDTVDVTKDSNTLRRLTNTPEDVTEAARRGLAYQHIIATRLGFFDSTRQAALLDGTSSLGSRSIFEDRRTSDYRNISSLSKDLVRDINEGIVADVKDVVELVREREYTDMMDYIIDVQETIQQRVFILFDSGPNVDAEQLVLRSE